VIAGIRSPANLCQQKGERKRVGGHDPASHTTPSFDAANAGAVGTQTARITNQQPPRRARGTPTDFSFGLSSERSESQGRYRSVGDEPEAALRVARRFYSSV